MNITHQNEKLKKVHEWGIISKAELESALCSPVFEFQSWQGISDEEVQWLMSVDVLSQDTGKHVVVKWSPFPTFRIVGRGGFQQCWHDKKAGRWKSARYYDMKQACEEYGLAYTNIGEVIAEVISGDNYQWNGSYRIFVQGKQRMATDSDIADRLKLEEGLMQCWYILAAFCCHTALPNTTVIRVKPPGGKHKSVKWHQSRTHYVLLTHMQAQRMQREKKPVTDHDIARASGWRRAHFRRLRSEKFTYMKGLSVPVVKCWVGPKEWEGTDKKIYRVWDVEKPTMKQT